MARGRWIFVPSDRCRSIVGPFQSVRYRPNGVPYSDVNLFEIFPKNWRKYRWCGTLIKKKCSLILRLKRSIRIFFFLDKTCLNNIPTWYWFVKLNDVMITCIIEYDQKTYNRSSGNFYSIRVKLKRIFSSFTLS